MKRVHMILGGAIFMVPAFEASSSYLARVGPKPLNVNAPTPPLGDVISRLPPLQNGLPEKPAQPSDARNEPVLVDPGPLGPVFPEPEPNPGIGLPQNWPTPTQGTSTDGNPPSNAPASPGEGIAPSTSQVPLSPENLLRFFIRPAHQPNPGQPNTGQQSTSIAIPVPFIPGTPSTPNSSRVQFRQE